MASKNYCSKILKREFEQLESASYNDIESLYAEIKQMKKRYEANGFGPEKELQLIQYLQERESRLIQLTIIKLQLNKNDSEKALMKQKEQEYVLELAQKEAKAKQMASALEQEKLQNENKLHRLALQIEEDRKKREKENIMLQEKIESDKKKN